MSRAVALLATIALASTARAEPSDRDVVLAGIAMAPPMYVLGVSLHESSHALAAELVGASVDELHLFPPGRDPHAGVFRFGWTYVHGLSTRRDQELFYLAPKITDVALLGGFAALVYSGAWPHNRYGSVALTVVGTGLWVDFAKDVVLFSPNNDVTKVFDLWCMKGWRQLPARLVYAAAAVGLGFIVAHGYERTFVRDPAPTNPMVPVFATAF